jgi:hypothetical protein
MARQKTNGWIFFIAFLAIVAIVVALGFGMGWFKGGVQQEIVGGVTPSGQPVSAGCNQNPSITTGFVDALSSGSAVSGGTNYYRVNDVYTGTTAPVPNAGDKVQILASNTSYISAILPAFNVHCGGNLVTGSLYKYANGTIAIKTDAGTAVLTNAAAGGAVNETLMSGSKSWAMTIKGTDKYSTGKVLMVVEFCSPANVSSVTLSENGVAIPSVAVPMGYTRQATNAYATAFEITPTTIATTRTFYLNGAVNTATQCSGAVYTTFYGEQAYVDTDGTFKEGAFDSLNTAKYVTGGKYSYNFLIAAS